MTEKRPNQTARHSKRNTRDCRWFIPALAAPTWRSWPITLAVRLDREQLAEMSSSPASAAVSNRWCAPRVPPARSSRWMAVRCTARAIAWNRPAWVADVHVDLSLAGVKKACIRTYPRRGTANLARRGTAGTGHTHRPQRQRLKSDGAPAAAGAKLNPEAACGEF